MGAGYGGVEQRDSSPYILPAWGAWGGEKTQLGVGLPKRGAEKGLTLLKGPSGIQAAILGTTTMGSPAQTPGEKDTRGRPEWGPQLGMPLIKTDSKGESQGKEGEQVMPSWGWRNE